MQDLDMYVTEKNVRRVTVQSPSEGVGYDTAIEVGRNGISGEITLWITQQDRTDEPDLIMLDGPALFLLEQAIADFRKENV